MKLRQRLAMLRLALLVGALVALSLSPRQVQAARLDGGVPWKPIFESHFAANAPTGWPIVRTDTYSEGIANGRYVFSVTDGTTHLEGPRPPLTLADGQITAVVRLTGHGQVGLAARMDQAEQSGYAFWIDKSGR